MRYLLLWLRLLGPAHRGDWCGTSPGSSWGLKFIFFQSHVWEPSTRCRKPTGLELRCLTWQILEASIHLRDGVEMAVLHSVARCCWGLRFHCGFQLRPCQQSKAGAGIWRRCSTGWHPLASIGIAWPGWCDQIPTSRSSCCGTCRQWPQFQCCGTWPIFFGMNCRDFCSPGTSFQARFPGTVSKQGC